jgi:hypothetical protein
LLFADGRATDDDNLLLAGRIIAERTAAKRLGFLILACSNADTPRLVMSDN